MSENIDNTRAVIEELTQTINAGDYAALRRLFVSDYADRYDNEPLDSVIQTEQERAAAFEDKHEEISTILVDPEYADSTALSVWYDVTGTHAGEFLQLPPTGNSVSFPLIRTVVLEDDEITRYRVVYTLGFLLDLGLDWEALTEAVDTREYLTTPDLARQ